MLSGAGIQNKIIQAMGSGKCVVTTPIGAEGLIIKGEIAIEKNDNDMAERIIFLLSHKDVRCAMGKDAESMCNRIFHLMQYLSNSTNWLLIYCSSIRLSSN